MTWLRYGKICTISVCLVNNVTHQKRHLTIFSKILLSYSVNHLHHDHKEVSFKSLTGRKTVPLFQCTQPCRSHSSGMTVCCTCDDSKHHQITVDRAGAEMEPKKKRLLFFPDAGELWIFEISPSDAALLGNASLQLTRVGVLCLLYWNENSRLLSSNFKDWPCDVDNIYYSLLYFVLKPKENILVIKALILSFFTGTLRSIIHAFLDFWGRPFNNREYDIILQI